MRQESKRNNVEAGAVPGITTFMKGVYMRLILDSLNLANSKYFVRNEATVDAQRM